MIEEHIHGAFGVDFNTAEVKEILFVAEKLFEKGIGGFFPTLVTDSVENIKRQISIIKEAAKSCPRILGIHLEGIFINPEKKGIHNPEHFLALTIENYKLIEDDFINTISSSLVKRLCSYGEYIDVMKLVPANIHQELMAIYLKPRFTNLFFNSNQAPAERYWKEIIETYKVRSYHNLSNIGYMFKILDI